MKEQFGRQCEGLKAFTDEINAIAADHNDSSGGVESPSRRRCALLAITKRHDVRNAQHATEFPPRTRGSRNALHNSRCATHSMQLATCMPPLQHIHG